MPHPTYDDLALALWEILPHMADACRLLKDHGETEWADKVQALIGRHWDLGAPGAIVAHRRGLGGDGSSARSLLPPAAEPRNTKEEERHG